MNPEPTVNADAIRRGRRLEYITVIWNLGEGVAAVAAGALAGSIALVGFGLDSFIEVASGGALIWRLHYENHERREHAERTALKIVGSSFLALALYVLVDAANSLWHAEAPATSRIGIAVAIVSLVVMPLLARAKHKVARALNSAAMHADSRQTDICAYLSAILLGGLILNGLLGWWWADPVAALAMVPLITYEGIEALRGRDCC